MKILSLVCETPSFLWIIYIVNLFRRLLFLFLPISLIIVIIIKAYKNIINTTSEIKDEIKNVSNKIIALIIVIIIPIVVDIIIPLFGVDIKSNYQECRENATPSKIEYYSSVENKVNVVKELLSKVKARPTLENLQQAEEEVSKLYGVANGSIIEDLEYELGSLRTKITMTEDEFICKSKGGSYENSKCIYKTPSVSIRGSSSGMTLYTFKSQNDYLVVNTKISVVDYVKYIQSNKICQTQNGFRYGDQCLCFAEEHLHGLINGGTTKKASQISGYYYSGFVKDIDDDDKTKILNIIYSELIDNKPVILQVNGKINGTSRHYVTVIGFKSNVTDVNNLKETDLLLIDSNDAKVKELHEWGTSRFMTTGAKCGKSYSGYQVYILK